MKVKSKYIINAHDLKRSDFITISFYSGKGIISPEKNIRGIAGSIIYSVLIIDSFLKGV